MGSIFPARTYNIMTFLCRITTAWSHSLGTHTHVDTHMYIIRESPPSSGSRGVLLLFINQSFFSTPPFDILGQGVSYKLDTLSLSMFLMERTPFIFSGMPICDDADTVARDLQGTGKPSFALPVVSSVCCKDGMTAQFPKIVE